MKRTELIVLAAIVAAQMGIAPASGQQDTRHWGRHYVGPGSQELFSEKEISLDFYGAYSAPETKFSHVFQTSIRDGGTWGGGVGMNYFLTRVIGVGGEVNIGDNRGSFVDSVAASLIARLPMENAGLAPYVFGGGGRTTDQIWEWTAHVGFGLEYRFNRETGIFADARLAWGDQNSDSAMIRAGLRLVF